MLLVGVIIPLAAGVGGDGRTVGRNLTCLTRAVTIGTIAWTQVTIIKVSRRHVRFYRILP